MLVAVPAAIAFGMSTRASAAGSRPDEPGSSNPYGVLLEAGRTADRDVIRETFRLARAAGIGWVRTDFFWRVIEPARGRFRWDHYDAMVAAATEHGIALLGILAYTAPWASRDPAGRDDKQPPRDMDLYGEYVRATVARYRERVSHWEVWNEPDHARFWKGSAQEYAALLAHAYRRIKAANPAARVILGGLAQGGKHDPRFLETVLGECRSRGSHCFDVAAFHTNFRDQDGVRRQFAANRSLLAAHGVDVPIWVTESSYTSDPRHQRLPGYQDGDAGQGRYLVDTMTLTLKLGAERVFWALMHDLDKDAAEYTASGLLTVDGRPKPVYGTYRRLATGR